MTPTADPGRVMRWRARMFLRIAEWAYRKAPTPENRRRVEIGRRMVARHNPPPNRRSAGGDDAR